MDLLGKTTLKEEKLKKPYLVQNQCTDASREGKQGEGGSKNENFVHQKGKPVKPTEYTGQAKRG